jgi:hypothetical protein
VEKGGRGIHCTTGAPDTQVLGSDTYLDQLASVAEVEGDGHEEQATDARVLDVAYPPHKENHDAQVVQLWALAP